MAKRDKEEKVEKKDKEPDNLELSKDLIKAFNKEGAGKIAWCLATDADNPTDVKEFISTGSTLLDYLIRNKRGGGVPVGKLTEIVGEEASGKSLVCAHLIAEVQRRGGVAVYIDTESAANPEFMERLGVNLKELVYLQPATVEDVGDVIEQIVIKVRTSTPNRLVLVIWDSVAGTPCRVELEGAYEINMNVQLEKSKALSLMMRKLNMVWGKERIALVFTNQLKTKIGVVYGDPMTTPGGKAIPYHASVRLRLNRSSQLKEGEAKDKGRPALASGDENVTKGQTFGIRTYAKVIKSRLGPPLRQCEFDILFSSGIDDVESWRDYLHEAKELEKDNGFFYMPSWPSGDLEEKGAYKGQDRGLKFREGHWKKIVNGDPKLKEHVRGLLEKHLIVKYGEAPKDMALDPESLMDMESATDMVVNPEAPSVLS